MTANSPKRWKHRPIRAEDTILPIALFAALATAGAMALATYKGESVHYAREIIERPAMAAAAE
jgi:hypothetical protein